jgi:hypothetical protein
MWQLLPLTYRHIRHPLGHILSKPAGVDRSQVDTPRFAPAVGCGSPWGPAGCSKNPLFYMPQPGAAQWSRGRPLRWNRCLPCSSLAVLGTSHRTGVRMWFGFQPRSFSHTRGKSLRKPGGAVSPAPQSLDGPSSVRRYNQGKEHRMKRTPNQCPASPPSAAPPPRNGA